VAAKRLQRGASEKEEQRFASEYGINLKAALQCGGAGVCQVYGFLRQGGSLCIIMKVRRACCCLRLRACTLCHLQWVAAAEVRGQPSGPL
jgi:hypothetical protein